MIIRSWHLFAVCYLVLLICVAGAAGGWGYVFGHEGGVKQGRLDAVWECRQAAPK